MEQLQQIYQEIHKALHNPDNIGVKINGSFYPITTNQSNGCRQLIYHGIQFIQQNKEKNSEYAKKAREGAKITWGIQAGKWLYFEN